MFVAKMEQSDELEVKTLKIFKNRGVVYKNFKR